MKNLVLKVGQLFILCLLINPVSFAAPLTNFTVTPADLTAGATTTYTVQFDAASSISTSSTNWLRFVTGSGGANLDNAVVQSSSPNITINCSNCTTVSAFIRVTASSVGPGDTVTFVLGNVVNPPSPGLGPNYTMNVEDSGYTAIDTATIGGSLYTGNNSPVVANQIPNQSIQEQDGAITVDLNSGAGVNTNLNYTFTDGDGDPMTFSIVAGHDTNVVTAQVVSEELVITGQGTGSTFVTVEADDSDEGTITDTFNVSVIGSLEPASVTPASVIAGDTTNYTVVFQPATVINSGDFIILTSQANNQDHTNSTFVSLSGGLSGFKSAGSANHTVIWLNGGSAGPGDTVTLVLGNIVNPGAAGQSDDYTLRTTDGGSTTGIITVPGTVYGSTSTPTVVNPIPNQSIQEQQGSITVDLNSGGGVNTDLNYTFVDGDGHPLTFTIDNVGDTNVVTAQVISDELIITGQGTGSTTVTVRADDMIDGSVTDTFNVSVVGSLAPASVTPSSNVTAVNSTYTVVFQPATVINNGDFIILSSAANNQIHTNSTLVSLSGGLSGIRSAGSASHTVIQLNGGSAGPGDSITMVLGDIVNPAAAGQSDDYTLSTTDGGNTTGIITIAGSVYIGTNLPTVANPIPDQDIDEESGSIVVDLNSGAGVNTDLNFTFDDADGHTLAFSIDAGHDTNVVLASIVNDELVITGQGTGTTTVTVRADDSIDGSVADSFDVAVIGSLAPASVVPSSFNAGELESYTIQFRPSVSLSSGDTLTFSAPGGQDQSNSSLGQISGGSITGSVTFSDQDSSVVTFNGGLATPGDLVTIVLDNIFNPVAVGMGPDYLLTTSDTGIIINGRSTVNGDVFVASDLIYENGFEQVFLNVNQANNLLKLIADHSASKSNQLPKLNTSFNTVVYFDQQMRLTNFDDMMLWFETVLAVEDPYGDFDGDGIFNQLDFYPLGF